MDAGTPLGELIDTLALPVVTGGHRSRGQNPLARITDDLVERRRRSGQVTRLLRLFADHGLIHKIAKTHRYQLTAEGRRLLTTFPIHRARCTFKLKET